MSKFKRLIDWSIECAVGHEDWWQWFEKHPDDPRIPVVGSVELHKQAAKDHRACADSIESLEEQNVLFMMELEKRSHKILELEDKLDSARVEHSQLSMRYDGVFKQRDHLLVTVGKLEAIEVSLNEVIEKKQTIIAADTTSILLLKEEYERSLALLTAENKRLVGTIEENQKGGAA